MKKLKIGGAVAAVFLALSSWASSLEVTDVKIAQRYPWNGLVDITYTVKSDDANKDVWVYPVGYDADTATSVALMPQYLSGEGASNAVHQGTHQMTWNMAAQMGKDYNRAAFSVRMHAYWNAAPWMVIDLSGGKEATSYPVDYYADVPEGGWTKEYEESKMVFRLIPPRTLKINGNTITLTQPFYCAVFPLTFSQLTLFSDAQSADMSYDLLRGSTLGKKWPGFQQVDGNSILAKLRIKTGMTVDLPTEAQWLSAACYEPEITSSTSYAFQNPNGWGMKRLGVYGEWCRDWYQDKFPFGIDSVGPSVCSKDVKTRVVRGRWFGGVSDSRPTLEKRDYYVQKETHDGAKGAYYFTSSVASFTYGIWVNSRSELSKAGLRARLVVLPSCK